MIFNDRAFDRRVIDERNRRDVQASQAARESLREWRRRKD